MSQLSQLPPPGPTEDRKTEQRDHNQKSTEQMDVFSRASRCQKSHVKHGTRRLNQADQVFDDAFELLHSNIP